MKRFSALIALTALTATANASTVTSSFTNPFATTEINQTGTLALFDSTLGTLLGAMITVTGNAVMNVSGTNNSDTAEFIELAPFTRLSWTTTLSPLSAFLLDKIKLEATSGELEYQVGETFSFGPLNATLSNTDNLASILASMQASGGGAFNVSCTSKSGISIFGGGGNVDTTQATTANCGASITYTYEAAPTNVPEPGTMALVGLALAGAGVFSRRRNKAV